MSNSDATATLEHVIESLHEIEGLAERAAPLIADAFRKYLRGTIAAGTTPYGEAWRERRRREGGGQALQNAGAALGVEAIGVRVFTRVTGPEARHHRGIVKGGIKRMIIPVRVLPPVMAAQAHEILTKLWNETMAAPGGT